MSILKKYYRETVIPQLRSQFSYANPMQIPSLKKIVISMGLAEASKDKNAMQDCFQQLMALSGQKPIFTLAKKSISNFKLRQGSPIGLKVTLRGQRMYDFVYRFIHIVCPRIRDFRGLDETFDHCGNYNMGLSDQQCFPEIDLDKVKREQGMNIVFVTSAKKDREASALLHLLGFPFKKKEK